MTPEELLKPRYKVIADWPGVAGKVKAGDILSVDDEFINDLFWVGGKAFTEDKIKDYPHLFKPLEWYEERKESDMPEYIKFKDENYIIRVDCFVGEIGFNFYHGESSGYGKRVFSKNTVPATKEEYEKQKQ